LVRGTEPSEPLEERTYTINLRIITKVFTITHLDHLSAHRPYGNDKLDMPYLYIITGLSYTTAQQSLSSATQRHPLSLTKSILSQLHVMGIWEFRLENPCDFQILAATAILKHITGW